MSADAVKRRSRGAWNKAATTDPTAFDGCVDQSVISEVFKALPPGSHVLDLGCGVGHTTEKLVAAGFQVSGCDLANNALKIARLRVPSADLKFGSLEKIPFDADSFDGAWFWDVAHFCHKDTFKASVVELERVLKPGAVACLRMMVSNGSRELRSGWFYNVRAGGKLFIANWLCDELVETLTSSGFEIMHGPSSMSPPNHLGQYDAKVVLRAS